MPVSLSGTPADPPTTLDSTAADPALELMVQVESGMVILSHAEALAFAGLYPVFYPGQAVFPGGGTNLGATPAGVLSIPGTPA